MTTLQQPVPGIRGGRGARRPGDVLIEGLTLVEPIGDGGMGEIWRAHHARLDTDVAVKLIRADAFTPSARTRFDLEARAAARIRSPHVVRVFDHGETAGGDPFIVMELLEGETLGERLERLGALDRWDAAELVRQIAVALEGVHGAEIVHRDVKPDNVWLLPERDEDFVKLVDFGIARTTGLLPPGTKLTGVGQPIGSPSYMSPEQHQPHAPIDARADLWALAVCAYEMLTSRLPFPADSLRGTIEAIVRGCYEPPSRWVDLPRAVDDFFARAFALDPSARFQHAAELSDAFSAALGVERCARRSMPRLIVPRPPVQTRVEAVESVSVPKPHDPSPDPVSRSAVRRRRAWMGMFVVIASVIGITAVTGIVELTSDEPLNAMVGLSPVLSARPRAPRAPAIAERIHVAPMRERQALGAPQAASRELAPPPPPSVPVPAAHSAHPASRARPEQSSHGAAAPLRKDYGF